MSEPIVARTAPLRRGVTRWLAAILIAYLCLRSLRHWKEHADPLQATFIGSYLRASIIHAAAPERTRTTAQYLVLRETIYGDKPVWNVLFWPLVFDVVSAVFLFTLAYRYDNRQIRALRRGRQISGPVMHKWRSFNRTVKGDGMSIAVAPPRWIEWLHPNPVGAIKIPTESSYEHVSVSGAPGAGKTQTLQHLVDSIMERSAKSGRKTVFVFFDPHCTFLQRYYQHGDWVGNPYDRRGFSWCPTWELDLTRRAWSRARTLSMARSLYVGKQNAAANDNSAEFFNRSAQLLYQQLVVDHQPREAQELAFWLDNPEEEIVTRVTGKIKNDLSPGSAPQKNGIMSSASMPQQAFEAIPLSGWFNPDGTWHQNAPRFTVKDYGEHRDRNLFFTSDADTIDALQPFQSMLIDMLFRKVIAMGKRPDLPDVVFVIDEADAAQRIPMLQKAANQIRKFNALILLGFQSRNQLDAIYGRDVASAILSAMKTQIYHRTGEGDSAEWQSKNIGEVEYEELQESWPNRGSGTSGQIRAESKKKPLLTPAAFMGLRNRQTILRYESNVVKYRVAISPERIVTLAFVPRPDRPVVKGVKREPLPVGDPKNAPPKTNQPDGAKSQGKPGKRKIKLVTVPEQEQMGMSPE